jgi:hypothetical protein
VRRRVVYLAGFRGLLAVTLAASGLALGAAGYTPTAVASNAGSQCLPLPATATPAPAASPSASPTSLQVLLCVIVRPSESSVGAGRDAGFAVQVETENGAAPDVSVTLAASAGRAVFTGLCPSGDGAASCQLGPLGTDVTPSSFTLHAQIATPSSGKTSVSLTASADSATNPPTTAQATGTTTVTAIPAKTPAPSKTPTDPVPAPIPLPSLSPGATVRAVLPNPSGLPATAPAPAGSVPASTAPAGNASSLFPVITPERSSAAAATSPAPADGPSPVPVAPQASGGGGKSLLTIVGAVLLGLIALALAGFLITTRRRRTDE